MLSPTATSFKPAGAVTATRNWILPGLEAIMSTEIVGPAYTGSFYEQEDSVNAIAASPQSERASKFFLIFFMSFCFILFCKSTLKTLR